MLGAFDDHEFDREWDHQFLRSVYAAAKAAYERTAGAPPEMAYAALVVALQARGIEPDREAVYAAAHLISRQRQPAILKREELSH